MENFTRALFDRLSLYADLIFYPKSNVAGSFILVAHNFKTPKYHGHAFKTTKYHGHTFETTKCYKHKFKTTKRHELL